jgi:hypothetical protein
MSATQMPVARPRSGVASDLAIDDRPGVDRWVTQVCIAAGVAATLLFWLAHRSVIDDAYITMSYARNLAFHFHWGLIPGEPSNSATSPLNVLLLAAGTVVLRNALLAVGVVYVVANLAFVWWMMRTASVLRLPFSSTLLAIAVVVLHPFMMSSIGMETMLTAALLMGLLCYTVQGRPLAFGVVAGLAVLTRLDLIIFVVVLGLCTKRMRRGLGIAVVSAAALNAPWLVWSWVHFGSAVPDTFLIKTLQHWTYSFFDGPLFYGHRQPGTIALSFVPALLAVLAMAMWLLLLAARAVDRRMVPVVALGLGGLGYYGAYSILNVPPYVWYYCPVIVALSVTAAVLLPEVFRGVPSKRLSLMGAARTVVIVVVLAQAIVVLGHDLPSWREPVIVGNSAPSGDYLRAGKQLRARIKGRAVSSPSEIGALAFSCECAIINSFSDRSLIVPLVESRIAAAGPISRFLLKLNYWNVDREVLPHPIDYTLENHVGPAGRGEWGTYSTTAGVRHLSLVPRQHLESTVVASLAREVLGSLPSGHGPVLIRSSDGQASEEFFDRFENENYVVALAGQLKRRGISVRLDPLSKTPLGARREYDGQSVRAVLTVATLDSAKDTRLDEPGGSLVAYWGKPWAERLTILSRLSALDAAHEAGTIQDLPYFFERLRLTKDAAAVAVFAGPIRHERTSRGAR